MTLIKELEEQKNINLKSLAFDADWYLYNRLSILISHYLRVYPSSMIDIHHLNLKSFGQYYRDSSKKEFVSKCVTDIRDFLSFTLL